MKNYSTLAAIALFAAFTTANAYAQQSSTPDNEETMMQTVAKIEKKTDKFNLYFNMHGALDNEWVESDFTGSRFQFRQFRIEAKGNINSWLSYRYRQRLTKTQEPQATDNLAAAIDIAGIGVKPTDKLNLFLGKQCASYGGIEFDLNPIEIYQYSDMVDYMSNFMTGVNVAYNFTPDQQLQFQVLDAINESSYQKYGDYTPAKIPFVYTLNWNGNFMDVYKTRWSASVMNETKGEHMYYFALGNEFNITKRLGAYFDWMYSIENVDRKGIITDIVGGQTPNCMATKADYMSFVLHLNYRFTPNWNVFGKFMYETAGVYKDHKQFTDYGPVGIEKGKYRTALGYIGGIEYYPMNNSNLHFYLAYIGRDYRYTDRAKMLGQADYNTSRVSLGFIWQMPVF